MLPHRLSLFPRREIALLARHDAAWMPDVEQEEREQHGGGIETVLICLVDGDAGRVAVGVFNQAENDADDDEAEDGVEHEEQTVGLGVAGGCGVGV